MDIAAQDRTAAIVVFCDQVGPVIAYPHDRTAIGLVQAAIGIIAQRHAARPLGQAVVDIISVAVRAIIRENAAGVVAQRGGPGLGQLVEPVDAVGSVNIVMAGPGVQIIAAGQLFDLTGRVVLEGGGGVIGRA